MTNTDAITAIFEAAQGGAYEEILEAARQIDAARPTDDMHQWTSVTSSFDAGWLRKRNREIDREVRKTLSLHPAWHVVEAIETGLKQRGIRIVEAELRAKAIQTIVSPKEDYEKSFYQDLRNMAGNINEQVCRLDQMNIETLAQARRHLSAANVLIRELLAECDQAQEVAESKGELFKEFVEAF